MIYSMPDSFLINDQKVWLVSYKQASNRLMTNKSRGKSTLQEHFLRCIKLVKKQTHQSRSFTFFFNIICSFIPLSLPHPSTHTSFSACHMSQDIDIKSFLFFLLGPKKRESREEINNRVGCCSRRECTTTRTLMVPHCEESIIYLM